MVATLKQYAKHKDGTYVSMLFNKESKQALGDFVKQDLGLVDRIDPSEYHCTLIYSRTPVPDAETAVLPKSVSALPLKYELFNTKEGNKCLVLRLNCYVAHSINELLTKMGATSDYPEYKPHVTICYDYKGSTDINDLPLPQFNIVFDDYEIKPLEVDYIPKSV